MVIEHILTAQLRPGSDFGVADIFKEHSTETDWEWAAKRRTLFKTPKVGVFTGIGTFVFGILVRGSFGEPNWFRASLFPALTAVLVAVVGPQVETAIIWLRRHKIRLDELQANPPVPAPVAAPPTPVVNRPKAEVDFECDNTGWARLRIRNAGAGGTFTVTLQLHGLTAGAVEGRQVFARWELGDGPHQRLGRGETRVVRLATMAQIAPGVRAWAVHRADGDDIKGVELVELLEVTVVSDPDLEENCQLQILLDATGASAMARAGIDQPLFRHVPPRVAEMRRLLVEVADYVRAMPYGRGDAKAAIWMAVTVHEKVATLLGEAFGPREIAVYALKLKDGEGQDPREVCAAFLLDRAQQLTQDEILRTFPLPITWTQYYERQPDWEWPDSD
jgi:hypothetical protein